MDAQPIWIDTVPCPRLLDGNGEVVFLEKSEGEKSASARTVAPQIGKQRVVTERERPKRVGRPFGGAAALAVNEKDGRPGRGVSGRCEDRCELRRGPLASRVAVVGNVIPMLANRVNQNLPARGAGSEPDRRDQPIRQRACEKPGAAHVGRTTPGEESEPGPRAALHGIVRRSGVAREPASSPGRVGRVPLLLSCQRGRRRRPARGHNSGRQGGRRGPSIASGSAREAWRTRAEAKNARARWERTGFRRRKPG